jgi:hypothetical protein
MMENWTEERARLVRLIKAIESGKVTHIDRAGERQLEPTSDASIAALRARLAQLESRLRR